MLYNARPLQRLLLVATQQHRHLYSCGRNSSTARRRLFTTKITTTKGDGNKATTTPIKKAQKLVKTAESSANLMASAAGLVGISIAYNQHTAEKKRSQAETTRELMLGINDIKRIFSKVIGYRHLQCIAASRDNRKCDWHDRAAMDVWLYTHHAALYKHMDDNQDGYLTFEELKKGLMACMMPEDEVIDFIDYLYRLTYENRKILGKSNSTPRKSSFFSLSKTSSPPHHPGMIPIADIVALKPILKESRIIYDGVLDIMDFTSKAATYYSLRLIGKEQLPGILDKMFIKNYMKNIMPLNIGFRRRIVQKHGKKRYHHDAIEKSFHYDKTWKFIKSLSELHGDQGCDPSKMLKKQVNSTSEYYRFADSPEGRRVLPKELLTLLSTSSNADNDETQEKIISKGEAKGGKNNTTIIDDSKKMVSSERNAREEELESKLKAAEMEIKLLRKKLPTLGTIEWKKSIFSIQRMN